jgi:hypothetical protein
LLHFIKCVLITRVKKNVGIDRIYLTAQKLNGKTKLS